LKFILGIELNAKGKVFWSVGHVMALDSQWRWSMSMRNSQIGLMPSA